MSLGDRKAALFSDNQWQAIVDELVAESCQQHCRGGSDWLIMGCRHHQS